MAVSCSRINARSMRSGFLRDPCLIFSSSRIDLYIHGRNVSNLDLRDKIVASLDIRVYQIYSYIVAAMLLLEPRAQLASSSHFPFTVSILQVKF